MTRTAFAALVLGLSAAGVPADEAGKETRLPLSADPEHGIGAIDAEPEDGQPRIPDPAFSIDQKLGGPPPPDAEGRLPSTEPDTSDSGLSEEPHAAPRYD